MAGELTAIEHLNACAVAAKNFINGMIGQLAGMVTDGLEELEEIKADKAQAVSITIPAEGWGNETSVANYPNYYDVQATGVTAADRASVTIAPNSQETAIACGLCPTNETLAGKIRIRAASIPKQSMAAEYWIEQGKE